jgi:cytochrome b involved in lipid metabolism
LPTLYTSVDDIDLFVGGLLETHHKGILGPLFHAIIKDQFVRLRDGDRYWFENPGVLSVADLASVKQDTLSKLILRNTNITFFPTSAFVYYHGDFIDGKSQSVGSGATTQSNSVDFVPGVFSMKWTTTGSTAVVTLCHKNPGWFAVGFGQTIMAGADMIVITRENGIITAKEFLGTGNVDPTVKSVQSLQLNDVSTAEGCTNAVTFTLPSYVSISTTKMIYALSSTSYTFGYHGPANRGSVSLNFQSSTTPTSVSQGVSFLFKLFHGGSMLMVYVFLYPAGVFLARYYHGLANWVDYHQLMMSIGMTQSLFTVLSIVIANNGLTFRPTVHRILGIMVALINLITYSLGNSIKLKNSKLYIKYRRKIHIILGYFTCLGGLVNCFFGLLELAIETLPYIFLAVLLLLAVVFYLAARYSTAVTHFSPVSENIKQVPVFDWSEILNRVSSGAKWLVIDGHVYDVQKFMEEHPGGSILLERVLGTDCTEQFGPILQQHKLEKLLGEDLKDIETTMDKRNPAINLRPSMVSKLSNFSSTAGMQMHKHSRLAHYRLTSLLVGKLKRDALKRPGNNMSISMIEENINTALSPIDFKPIRLIKKDLVVSNEAVEKVYRLTFQFSRQDDTVEFNGGE